MPVVRTLITKLGYDYDGTKLATATATLQKYKKVLDAVTKAENDAEKQKAKKKKIAEQQKPKKTSSASKIAQFKRLMKVTLKGEKVIEQVRLRGEAEEIASIKRVRAVQKDASLKRRIELNLINDVVKHTARDSANVFVAEQKRMIASALASVKKQKAEVLQLLRMYQSIGRSVRNATLMFGFGVGRPLAGFLADSVKVSAEFEGIQTTFSVLLKDVDKATNLMADMRKLARDTPLDFKGIAKTGKVLLGTGMNTDMVMKRIHQLGEVTGGKKDIFERIAWQYAQSVAKGRPQGDELRRFGEAGVPLEAEIAKNLGVAQVAVREMSKKGTLTIEHLNTALDSLTKKGGLYHGLMKKKLNTLEGQMGKYLSLVEELKKTIGDDWKGTFTKVMKIINGILGLLLKMPAPLRIALVVITALVVGLVSAVSFGALLATAGLAVAMAFKTAKFQLQEMVVKSGLLAKNMSSVAMASHLIQNKGRFGKGKGILKTMGGAGSSLFGGLLSKGMLKGLLGFARFIPQLALIATAIGGFAFLIKSLKPKTYDHTDSLAKAKGKKSIELNINNNMEAPVGTSDYQFKQTKKQIDSALNKRLSSVLSGMVADTAGG